MNPHHHPNRNPLFAILLTGLLLLISHTPAQAWVGGPFDNGDYSATLDDQGVYQASIRYKNGSGYVQWANNADLGPSASSGSSSSSSTTTTATSSVGSYLNRAVLYYKGVAFFGNATGMSDMEAREVTCVFNSQSEVTLDEQSSTSSQTTTSSTVNASSSVVNNGGRGFVANGNFVAKITKTYPQLRFSGTGQLTLINPDAQSIIADLAQQIAESLSEISSDEDSTVVLTDVFDFLSDPDFLAAITPKTIDEVSESSETLKMTVTGSRRYFLSSR